MRRFVVWICVLGILLSSSNLVLADEIDKHRQEAEEINQDITKTRELLDQVKDEQATLAQQLEAIENDIKEKEEELVQVENKLENTLALLEDTREELRKAENEARRFKALMADRLCAMYMTEGTSYLELLFGARNLNDFLDRLEMVKFMITYDNQVFDKMMELQNAIKEKEEELAIQEETIRQTKTQIVEQKEKIEDKKQERLKLMAQLKEQEQEYIKDLEVLEQASKEIEKTIQRLLHEQEIKRQQEEQRRKEEEQRRQEEEKRKQEEQNKESGSEQSQGDNSQSSGQEDQNRGSNDKQDSNQSGGSQNTGSTLTWPVPGYYTITSRYGNRWHPVYNRYDFHTGIDISGSGVNEKSVVAAADGVVILSEYYGGYGNTVVIDHGGGMTTLYAHGSELLVSVGQKVSRGQAIMKVGSTGVSTGPHLHFEVRINGSHTNPLPYLGR
ncbi:MAG: peptidoglycan DD-metalloendopeptidase family protein [Caldicoprobacterales bacterium]